MKYLLMLLLLVSLSYATDGICDYSINSDYSSLVYLGVAFSVLYIGLKYVLSKLTNQPSLRSDVSVDLSLIVTYLLLYFSVVGVMESVCHIGFYSGGLDFTEGSLVRTVKGHLETATLNSLDAYVQVYNLLSSMSMIASFNYGYSIYGISMSNAPFTGFSSVVGLFSNLSMFLLTTHLSAAATYSLFLITQSHTFLEMLSIGFALSMLPFLRKFGGVLISVVLGMSVVFPLVSAFLYGIVSSPSFLDDDLFMDPYEAFNTLYTTSVAISALAIALATDPTGSSATVFAAALAHSLGNEEISLVSSIFLSYVYKQVFKDVFQLMVSYAIYSMFIPMVSVTVSAAFVSSLSRVIGTEVNIQGVMRVI